MVYTFLKDTKVNFSTETSMCHSHKSGTSPCLGTIKRMKGVANRQLERF